MHQCEEFRERIAEHIIGSEDLLRNSEFQRELLTCSPCSEFYAESREMIEALSAVDLSVSERQWHGIEHRVRTRILNSPSPTEEGGPIFEGAPGELRRSVQILRPSPCPLPEGEGDPPEIPISAPRSASAIARSLKALTASAIARSLKDRLPLQLLAAAAMLLITIGLYRLAAPLVNLERSATPATPAVYVGPSVSLDPVTVDFLEESELLLRNVMKITPNDMDDFADAQKVANGQLADIEQRKEAAADVPPVVGVMDTYETVLRDIRNVDERSATEDIADIQSRIRKNGLIANIKAFQPGVTPVSFGAR